MVHDVLFSLWFLLPAAAANVAPILAAHIPALKHWDHPLDFGHTWRSKRIFGAHKTWRGLLSGMIIATCVLALEQWCGRHFGWAHSSVDSKHYIQFPLFLLGPLFGIGALGGDAIESFFKRQVGIEPGHAWIPFDQVDYIIGGILVTLPFIILRPVQYVWLLIVWFLGHLLASYIGWHLGLKERPI